MTTSLNPHDDTIRLDDYQEACGRLERIEQTDAEVRVVLSIGALRFPGGSREAAICTDELADHIGANVSIMRVPSGTNPIVIQTASSPD